LRQYSVMSDSRRWPVLVFFNILDIVPITRKLLEIKSAHIILI